MGAVPYEVWTQAATAHLELDDKAGYHRVCAILMERQPRQIFESFVALTLAEVTTLAPGGAGADEKVLGWVRELPKIALDSAGSSSGPSS